MDYRNFNTPCLRRAQFWEKADALRSRFPSRAIRRQFGVSTEVIAKRLRVEKLWPPN